MHFLFLQRSVAKPKRDDSLWVTRCVIQFTTLALFTKRPRLWQRLLPLKDLWRYGQNTPIILSLWNVLTGWNPTADNSVWVSWCVIQFTMLALFTKRPRLWQRLLPIKDLWRIGQSIPLTLSSCHSKPRIWWPLVHGFSNVLFWLHCVARQNIWEAWYENICFQKIW